MRPFAQRFVRRLPHGIVALVVTLTGCGMGTPDPASDNVRTKAAAAAETLAGFTAGLKSGETVLAEFRADYCLEGIHNWKRDDSYDWDCTVTHNLALEVGQLRAGATMLHEHLLAAGCSPDTSDNTSRHGLPVMLDNYDQPNKPAHRYPDVRYVCGNDITLHVKPSDRTDERLGKRLVRPEGWGHYATGSASNRLMSGGEITPEDVARLTSAEGALMLLSARLRYHRA